MHPRLPLYQRLRPGQRAALDLLAAAGYGCVAWALFAHKITPWPLALAGTLLVAVPVAAGRRWPLAALAPALTGFWLAALAPTLAFLAVPAAGYALYRIAGRYRAGVGLALLAVALSGPAATGLGGHAGGVIPFAVPLVMAWTVGYARGEHHRYAEELVRHHARQVEAERERARRGAAEERMRIARELHDIVAHSMSVITVQAGYGHLVIDEQPAEARAALAAIEATGRQALGEMRRLLGVLRQDDGPELAPSPSLADLRQLVDRASQAGIFVELEIAGDPRDLPASIELSAYRIVQEALTNVIRHAGTATARVTVGYRPDQLSIEVTDDGRGGPPMPGGLGLTGMRERVQLHDGRLDAMPLPGRGFQVSVALPLAAGEPAT